MEADLLQKNLKKEKLIRSTSLYASASSTRPAQTLATSQTQVKIQGQILKSSAPTTESSVPAEAPKCQGFVFNDVLQHPSARDQMSCYPSQGASDSMRTF